MKRKLLILWQILFGKSEPFDPIKFTGESYTENEIKPLNK